MDDEQRQLEVLLRILAPVDRTKPDAAWLERHGFDQPRSWLEWTLHILLSPFVYGTIFKEHLEEKAGYYMAAVGGAFLGLLVGALLRQRG